MQSLYQDRLLALAKHARHYVHGSKKKMTHHAQIHNAICGDVIRAEIGLDDTHRIAEFDITAEGCALCEAGAGLWLNVVRARHLDEMEQFYTLLKGWLAGGDMGDGAGWEMEELRAFMPVRAIKNRHDCVLLAFATASRFQPIG